MRWRNTCDFSRWQEVLALNEKQSLRSTRLFPNVYLLITFSRRSDLLEMCASYEYFPQTVLVLKRVLLLSLNSSVRNRRTFLFNVQGTRSQRERDDVARRTDFLTDYTTVTYMIKYINDKNKARGKDRRT